MTVELVKIEEEGTTVELVKIETDVMFTEEWTELIDVTELKWEVVLLAASTDLEEALMKLLLENPLDEDIIEEWIRELLFETCGTRDDVTVALVKKDEDCVRVELVKIETEVVFTEE
mgnify:CR=1 FL=1